jgi:hypothetical protein
MRLANAVVLGFAWQGMLAIGEADFRRSTGAEI